MFSDAHCRCLLLSSSAGPTYLVRVAILGVVEAGDAQAGEGEDQERDRHGGY